MFIRKILFQPSYLLKAQTVLNCAISKFVRTRSYFDEMKSACVLVASGSEEMETIITVDVLRRAGIRVDLTGITTKADPIECSRSVILIPDISIDEAMTLDYDIIVLPGGLKGSEAFSASSDVAKLLKKQEDAARYIGAICAAPTALLAHSIYEGKVLTCYPSMADFIRADGRYKYAECEVVIDDKVITSRGPGTAIPFSLKIVEKLVGLAKAREVANGMLACYPNCTKIINEQDD